MQKTYKRINREGMEEVRVTECHPEIGKYVVRVTKILHDKERAAKICNWLNKVTFDRDGIEDLFIVTLYKGYIHNKYVVMRKLLNNDLESGIDTG